MRIIFLTILSVTVTVSLLQAENNRKNPLSFNEKSVLILNGIWDFKYIPTEKIGYDSLFYEEKFDVSSWGNIKVPGHWELQGFSEPTYNRIPEGVGLYRREFKVPPGFKNRQVFIQFNGVLYGYKLYVNGKYVGDWSGGFNATSFNITDYLDFQGENLLAVKVTTHPKGYLFDISDCWAVSGIFRDVTVFSTPQTFIQDYTVQTSLNTNGSAQVDVMVEPNESPYQEKAGYSLNIVLQSPEGKIITKTSQLQFSSGNHFHISVESPELWTAETPNLYKLKLRLLKGGEITQEKEQAVGIREISIDKAVLKLNGSPVKLRGVNHHDLTPETGRVMTREQILEDLLLMKAANINYIRTSHYPPDHRLLDMCDSLGIYVSCEVPFNDGRQYLTDTTYQDILLRRARATVFRDKNHPCIIIWTIGNENPSTKITEATGRYVQKTDPTRPICFAGLLLRSSKRPTIRADEPDFVDISSSHYKSVAWIRSNREGATKPFVMTEYAHALGTAFGNMEDTWAEMFRRDDMAGGAVWMFQDQGIYRKAEKPVDIHRPATYVWLDSVTYYDTGEENGVDGIVYSDRTPQVDYWHVRKVYSPVRIIEKELAVNTGEQNLKFSVYNQFDFQNLNVLKCNWVLLKSRMVYQSGILDLNCAPHDTVMHEIAVTLPKNLADNVWILQMKFSDRKGNPVYEHAVKLLPEQGLEMVKQKLFYPEGQLNKKGNEIDAGDFNFVFAKNNLAVTVENKTKQIKLITGGVYARVGRLGTVNDETVRKKKFSETGDYPWNPHLLQADKVTHVVESMDNAYSLSGTATFKKGTNFPGQILKGKISYKVENNGVLTVDYNLVPENTTGVLLEAGISFKLSENISDFIWLGDGPFASYPDKHVLNDFGVHYIKKGDLNFNGNRANVEVAILTDMAGNGIAIVGDHSNISVEVIDGQIIVSQNAMVSGNGNKKATAVSKYLVDAAQVKNITGSIKIMPLKANHWPKKLIETIGLPDKSKKPFTPFYHCYDWSR